MGGKAERDVFQMQLDLTRLNDVGAYFQNGGSHPLPGLRSAIDEAYRLDNWSKSVYDQCNMENYGRTCKIMIDRGGPNHIYEFADSGRITFLQGPGAIVVTSQEGGEREKGQEMRGWMDASSSPFAAFACFPFVSACPLFLQVNVSSYLMVRQKPSLSERPGRKQPKVEHIQDVFRLDEPGQTVSLYLDPKKPEKAVRGFVRVCKTCICMYECMNGWMEEYCPELYRFLFSSRPRSKASSRCGSCSPTPGRTGRKKSTRWR